MIFFSDFKKAYDSLEWDFIWKCLEKYNFGPNFIKWIQLLYKSPQVVIKNNGYLSDPVDLKRGVRQGCPVSCLIFILCLECLADKIRSNNNLNGLKLNITNIKLCLYADDITFFVKNEDELKECIREINMYGDVSGLTLNLKKCEGLWIGNYKFRQPGCKVCGINWPTEPIKCLGIYVGHNKNACDELNWNRKIVKMANILRCWRNRDLTIFGKVQIIKSLALPNIIYSANCCDIPNGVIQRINELIFNFIWGSTERIKRKTLISPQIKGGVKMIDIESQFGALKAAWVDRILKSKGKWSELPKKFINKFGKDEYILCTNVTKIKDIQILKSIPKFYQEVIIAFTSSKAVSEESFKKSILQQPLFCNRYFVKTIGRKEEPLFFINWINGNLVCLKNLRIRNGIIDKDFVLQQINSKVNLPMELAIVQRSLNKYKTVIPDNEPDEHYKPDIYIQEDKNIDISNKTSKFYYENFIEMKCENSHMERFWSMTLQENIDFNNVYKNKIIKIKDKKIAETNFKILHGILPCGENLKRWKIKVNSYCYICNENETILHLIFNCRYSNHIWQKIQYILNRDLTSYYIICGLNNKGDEPVNFLISLISHCIYKDWLVHSQNNKMRVLANNVHILRTNLLYYKTIYSETKSFKSLVPIINGVLENL